MNIAIVDSGIYEGHPHVGPVAGGVSLVSDDWVDRLGHGTAVAGAIREKATDAALYAVKIFDRRLSAEIDTIVRALEWCREQRMDVVNLSLGTANEAHREQFVRVLGEEAVVVSVAGMLPGSMDGVIAVAADRECPRDGFRFREGVFYASPYPRSIPGVPAEHNLSGVSFAVANMTGLVARVLASVGRARLRAELVRQSA